MECWRREPNLDFIRAHYKCEGKKCVVVMFSYYYGGGRSQQLPTPSCSEGCCVNDQDSVWPPQTPASPAAAPTAIGEDKQCGVCCNNQAGVGCLIKGGQQCSAVQCRAVDWLAYVEASVTE